MPVHQYILRRRVERAKLLLQDRSLSIAQVAFATGFAHQSHLARHMRKILGMTPAVVRARTGEPHAVKKSGCRLAEGSSIRLWATAYSLQL